MFKHTRKLISAVLTTGLLVSTFPAAIYAEDAAVRNEVVVADDFQSYLPGAAVPNGYDGNSKGNTWRIEQSEDGNKYYSMTVDTASDGHLDNEFGRTLDEKFVFQFDIRFHDYGQVDKWLYFIDGNGNDTFIIDISSNGTITAHDGTHIGSYALNKFYTIAIEIDPKEGLMSVKFNNKWRLNDHPIGACSPSSWRFHMRTPSGESTVDFDNLLIYTGEYTMQGSSDSSKDSSAGSSALDPYALKHDLSAMYIGKDSSLVKGQQVYISQNDEIVPYRNGEVKMVPVKAFIESLGGTASWNEADKSATFTANGKSLKLSMGTRTCFLDGAEKKLLCPADVGAGNVFYAPMINLCEFFGQYLHEEDNGLMIYSENNHDSELDWINNMNVIRNICESFMFDDVTGAEIAAMIETNHPNAGHPRLIFTEEKFARIRKEINDPNGDPIYKKLFSLLTTNCNRFLNETPSGYEIRDGIRLMDVVEENSENDVSIKAKWYSYSSSSSGGGGGGGVATSSYKVNFETNGGTAVDKVEATKGKTVTLADSTKEGFVFDGWYLDSEFKQKASNPYEVTGNVTLYAKWAEKTESEKDDEPEPDDDWLNPFNDVKEGSWYFEPIKYMYEKHYCEGLGWGQFGPDINLSRAMLVTILYRIENEPEVSGGSSFADVEDGLWYADAVTWAAEKGIVTGYNGNSFAPDDLITREQIAAILFRYAQFKAQDVSESADISTFDDFHQVSSYAHEPLGWAVARGYLNGRTETSIAPADYATRAEALTVLYRFIKK